MNPAAPPPRVTDESRDLQLILAAGGASALIFGFIVFVAGRTNVLNIPSREAAAMAALAGLVAVLGWLALRRGQAPRRIAWVVLLVYTFVITAAVHYTGGPQTPMPALYLLVIVAAAFVLGPSGVTLVAAVSLAAYAALLALEYTRVLPIYSIWNIAFEAKDKGLLLVVNWLAVATPAVLVAVMCNALTQRLRTRNNELRQSESMRTVLVELMVHDLRNPLTVLLGVLEVMQIISGSTFTTDQRRLMQNARRSGQVMIGLIGDMLDISRLETGQLKLRPQRLDMHLLVRDGLEEMRVPAEQAELTLAPAPVGDLPPVQGDAKLIQRVLANLLGNAVKATPPGGAITVETSATPPGAVTVSVHDTGQGIAPDQQVRIFDKFAQVEKERVTGRATGAGLGLTFCKMAVEAHGGRLWVESQPGQGSTFLFTLPAEAEQALPQRTSVEAPPVASA